MQRLSGLRVRRRWSARTASAVCRCKTPSDLQKAALHALDIPLGCQRCRCATTTDGTSHSPYSTEQRCTAGGAVAACASLEPRKWRLPERDAARAITSRTSRHVTGAVKTSCDWPRVRAFKGCKRTSHSDRCPECCLRQYRTNIERRRTSSYCRLQRLRVSELVVLARASERWQRSIVARILV
ncbi:hypothetical protein M440DRAFT_1091057 [Trichoderma longibrachiatum ATCC 18648]|uniref:Uncharacterized protein n=1 Tax=Trichoderma longibrachiatum ATCC 18648 TaxID=983965 RepID=A0A2T4BT75_TRILO|nr:hypothetical protein M440DRAFT_1091057 [Trichoderma longibrachiatum ATCC 18648]